MHRAGQADPGQVVAHEVDDHHVLRPVLGLQLRRGAPGSLDRSGADGVAIPLQEELRRCGRDLQAGQPDDPLVRRRVPAGQQRVQPAEVRMCGVRQLRRQDPAETGLIHVPAADGVPDGPHRGFVLALVHR